MFHICSSFSASNTQISINVLAKKRPYFYNRFCKSHPDISKNCWSHAKSTKYTLTLYCNDFVSETKRHKVLLEYLNLIFTKVRKCSLYLQLNRKVTKHGKLFWESKNSRIHLIIPQHFFPKNYDNVTLFVLA